MIHTPSHISRKANSHSALWLYPVQSVNHVATCTAFLYPIWNFFHHTIPKIADAALLSFFDYKPWIFGKGLHLKSSEPKSPQAARGFMSRTQLFKPRLFTDILLTIQLFILRQRPSPSHRQMQSNKAPRSLNDWVHWLKLCYNDTHVYCPQVILMLSNEYVRSPWNHFNPCSFGR